MRLTANGNGLDNLQIGTQAAPLVGTTFVGNITDSFFNNAQAGSGIVLSQQAGTGTLNLLNVQTSNNVNGPGLGGDGMGLFGSAATVMNVRNTNGQSNFNSRDGFHVEAVGGASVTLVVDPTFVTNNGRDGLFFDLSGASLLATTFLDDTMTDNGRSAVHGDLNNSTVLLTFDNTIGDRSGDSGFVINATNSSFANLLLTNGSSFVDSGQTVAGASGVEVNASGGLLGGSTVVLTMDGTPTGNTAIGGTADFGLTARATGAGSNVIVNANAAIFDNARTNAVRGLVNAGNVMLNLTDTTGNDAGGSGLLANVSNAGILTLELDNTSFLRAGADGLNALVATNSVFNACIINNSHFDNATGAGLRIITNGVGAADVLTESNVEMDDSTANGNLLGGVVAQVNTGGDLNFRTIGSSFDGNGTLAGSTDGVFVQADGASSFARMLFNTTSASDNRGTAAVGVNHGNGFNFEASNGATMTARLDSITATNNMGGYGVRLNATGAGTSAIVIPEGTNVINGNTLGSYSINYNGTGFAIVALNGSFNGQPGDGVHVDIQNVNTALVTLTGNGADTISNNAGDGVDISIMNAANAGIRIAGYSDISNNMGDGIHVVLSNITNSAAVEVLGPTNLMNNGDDGVDIAMTNVALGTFVPGGLGQLSVLSLNLNDPLNACLPEPTLVPFNTLVTSPTSNGVLLDQLNISRVGVPAVGQNGIDITGNNVTGTGTITTTNNTITNFNNMVSVALNASSAPIVITDTVVTGNSASGVNVALTNSVGQDVTITNVTANGNGANGVSVTGNGGTLGDVQLTNVTANNNTLNGINVDLQNLQLTSLLVDGQGTATANGNTLDGVHVALNNVTGVPSLQVGGYAQVNGNGQDGIDVSALATALGLVDLSNNTVNNGLLGNGISLVLNSNVTGPITMDSNVVNVSGLDGIRINLNGVTGGADVSTTNSNINNSGAIGINFTAVGATLGNVLLDPTIVQNSQLDGAHYDFTNATLASFLVDQLTFLNSGLSGAGDGLDVILDGAGGGPVTVSNTTATNSRDRGIAVHGSGGLNLGDITFTDVSSNSTNNSAGVAILLDGGTVGSIHLDNVTANDSGGQGIRVSLGPLTVGPEVFIRGLGTATANLNGGDGVSLVMSNVVGTPDVEVSGYGSVDQNGGRGIVVALSNNPIGSVLVDSNTISNSGGRGLDVILNGVTASPDVTVSNTTSRISGGRGVSIAGSGATLGDVTLTNVSSDTTTAGEGVAIVLDTGTVGAINLTNVSANASASTGILVDLNTETVGSPIALVGGLASFSTNNGGDGIFVNLNTVTGTPDVSITDYANVFNNAGRGIALVSNGSPVGAVDVSRNTVDNSTAGQGIQINLANSAVGSILADTNTISDSSGRGLDIILNGVTGAPDVTVSNTTATNSGGRGVSIAGSGATLGDVTLTNVSSATTTAGEGVALVLSNGMVGAINFNNVSANLSNTTGILVNLNTEAVGSPIALTGGPLSFSTNNGGDGIRVELAAVLGTPDISVTGYLLPNSINNNAGNGIVVLNNGSAVGAVTVSDNMVNNSTAGDGIQVTLSGTIGDVTLDSNTVSNSAFDGINVNLLSVTGGSDVTISNSTVTASLGGDGVRLFMGGAGTVLGDLLIDNVSATNSNDNGIAVIDLGGSSINSITLNQVSSDTTTAGQGGTGVMVQLLNTTNLTSVAMTGPGTVTNSDFDGISVILLGVTGTPDISIDGYTVDQSGQAGILILTNGSDVSDVSVSNFAVSNSGNDGVAILLDNSTVASVLVDSTTTNTITNSVRRGLNVSVSGVTGATTIDINNTDVTNSGTGGITGAGVLVSGTGSVVNPMLLGTITLTNVSSDTTGAESGVAVALLADNDITHGKVGDITLTNVTALNSFAGGIVTSLTDMFIDPSITIDGQGTALSANNGGDGILVTLNNTVTGTPTALDVSIDNYSSVDTNAGRGIALVSNGNSLGAVSVSNNIVSNSTAGQGIQLNIANSELGSLLVDTNTIDASFGRGLDVILDGVHPAGANPNPVITISNVTATNSGGRGISVAGSGATTFLGDILLTNVSSTTTTADEGVAVVFDTGATIDSVLLNNVSARSSAATGILVSLDTVTVGQTVMVDGQGSGQSNNNAGDGILVNLDTVTGTPDVNIDNYASVSTNTGRGIALVANATTLGNLTASGNTINGNTGGNGLTIDLTGSNATDLTIDGNTIGNNTGEGVFIRQNNSDVGPINIGSTGVGNIISGNTLNGVNFAVTNSDQGVVTFTENQITGQTGGDGVRIDRLADTDGSQDFTFLRNTITTNSGDGVRVVLPNAGLLNPTLNLSFTNDSITGNGSHGILVDLTANPASNVTANVTILSDGTINPGSGNNFSDISNNTGMGLFINSSQANVSNTNAILLTTGDTGGTGGLNLFNANQDAGIGIALGGGSTLQTAVAAASFTNSTNGGLANFNGDGFAVVMTNDTQFTNSTFDNMTFSGNAGSGFALRTTNAAFADSLTFSNSNFENNTGNGLLFVRNSTVPSNGFITNISIDNNQINDNNVGINISASFAPTTDTYGITNNTINSNTSHGIQLFLVADANLGVILDTNQITNNGGDGINARANYGPTDAGEYAIQSRNDTITGNTGDGIDVLAIHNVSIDLADISSNRANGVTLNGTNTFGNPFSFTPFGGATTNVNQVGNSITNSTVDFNEVAGIVMTNQGLMFINIQNNEVLGNTADGIDLINSGSMTSQVMIADIGSTTGNFIGFNGGDGIQYSGVGTGGNIVGNPGTFTATNEYATPFTTFLGNNSLTIANNTLTVNGARGINVLNAGNIATDLNISNNIVDRSQLEGVYIVNTAATAQNVDANANAAMATGDSLADPRLGLTVGGNQITSNGQIAVGASVFDTTGLVVRVGTSDASNSIRDNGGFASNAATTSATISANGGLVSQMGRGGVQALVTNKTFGGQFGADVTFQAYIGTDPPATTTGAWTDQNEGDSAAVPPVPRNPGNDVFRVDSYTSDPLARLDLVFNTNTGDALRATRADASTVFYNNAEAVFKSRTLGQDLNDPVVAGANAANQNVGDDGGPFNSGTRNRNATRLASNAAPFNVPRLVGSIVDVTNAGNGFLYPGVSGSSTFRRDTSAGGNVFTTSSFGFGTAVPQGGGVGEFAFLWSLLP